MFLLVSAMMHFYDQMHPRRRTDPAANPGSAKKVIEGVARRHIVRGIKMVPMAVVNLAVKGMCREYIEQYGVDTLVPERKLPFTDRILHGIFRTPEGSRRGALTVRWSDCARRRRSSAPAPGEEFTHAQLDLALQLLLVEGAGVLEGDLHNYSVHSFRIFAACALLAAGCPRWLIKRMLRWRGDESLEIYARVNDSEWADWTQKTINVAVDSTIASRLTYMDFSVETRQRFTDIAEAMLSLNAGTARAATGTL